MKLRLRLFDPNIKQYWEAVEKQDVVYYHDEDDKKVIESPGEQSLEIEQGTGLIDSQGVEIFEGDILESEEDYDKDDFLAGETYKRYTVVERFPGFFSNDIDNQFDLIINPHSYKVVGRITVDKDKFKIG